MQFYNSEIAKQLDKIEQEFSLLDKDVRAFVQVKFNDYIMENVRYSKKQFNEMLKKEIDFTNYLYLMETLPEEANKKNIEEIEQTMKVHNKERKKIYNKPKIEVESIKEDLLKFFESYYKFYENLIGDYALF